MQPFPSSPRHPLPTPPLDQQHELSVNRTARLSTTRHGWNYALGWNASDPTRHSDQGDERLSMAHQVTKWGEPHGLIGAEQDRPALPDQAVPMGQSRAWPVM